ncbi:eotaxin-like [Mastacembelus armatus]|uniref:Eotaxin-like n=1 Tax=Mastacembelus armatus TaxID=205130 RepID=A0A3Q3L7G8_9TELE|nr:eotaxin-like [Mastacembelus armatus]
MKTGHILLLCILGAAMLSTVICNNSIGPEDCCFEFYPRRIKKELLVSYEMTDHRCARRAALFVTKKSRRICMDPSLSWVQNIMKAMDEKSF